MTIHADPSLDPGKDPRRIRFEKMQKEGGTYEDIFQLIQEFIALGHNPKDPTDGMYVILGISPEFLETMLFTLRTQPEATIDEFSIIPGAPEEALAPAPTPEEAFNPVAAQPQPDTPPEIPEEAPTPLIKQA